MKMLCRVLLRCILVLLILEGQTMAMKAREPADCQGLKTLDKVLLDSSNYRCIKKKIQETSGDAQDLAALTDLYYSTGGHLPYPEGWLHKWNWLSTEPHCNWYGVSCNTDGRVYRLDLFQYNLTGDIPESISHLNILQWFSIAGSTNEIASLPASIGNLNNLQKLYLAGNELIGLPESIGNLDHIHILTLHFNQLISLPESIGNLDNLQTLTLHYNQLTNLPESIGNLSSLRSLTLHHNRLTALPESIGNLNNLQRLDLEINNLTELPDSIGNLNNLQILNLEANQLRCLPESFTDLSALRYLDLRFNHPSFCLTSAQISFIEAILASGGYYLGPNLGDPNTLCTLH